MDFGQAIEALKNGERVARAGWNGKRMWLCHMPATTIAHDLINGRTRRHLDAAGENGDLSVGGYIVMWTAQGVWQPGWLASQADMLAEDWKVIV